MSASVMRLSDPSNFMPRPYRPSFAPISPNNRTSRLSLRRRPVSMPFRRHSTATNWRSPHALRLPGPSPAMAGLSTTIVISSDCGTCTLRL